MPESLKQEMFEAARDPPKLPLEMMKRSVPPPMPMLPDQSQIYSGRDESADSEAKVSTPLVAPKSITRAPAPPDSVKAPRVSVTASDGPSGPPQRLRRPSPAPSASNRLTAALGSGTSAKVIFRLQLVNCPTSPPA